MDWTNPLTYGVMLALVSAGGAVIWKIFWWVAKIDPLPAGFSELAKEIRADIKQILIRLPPASISSASPVTLTEFGEKIAKSFGASGWSKAIAATIADKVTGMADFEVDEFCQRYVETNLDAPQQSEVARVAYEFGIEHQKVLNVLRVVLRDELLKGDRSTA